MGANISLHNEKTAPINIYPTQNILPIKYNMPIESAQIKSAIMLAALYAKGKSKILEKEKSRDHTENILNYLGTDIFVDNNEITLSPPKKINAKEWEIQKSNERLEKAKRSGKNFSSVLDDIALALPALMRAEKIGKRVSRLGFDWPNVNFIFRKINEEINELRSELEADCISIQKVEEELGDILLTVVSLARHLNIDPELALRKSNKKFEKRFRFVEKKLAKISKKPEEPSLKEYQLLWNEAKLNKYQVKD